MKAGKSTTQLALAMLKSTQLHRKASKSKAIPPLQIDQDSRSAWASLCKLGGIELEDRDADLEEALRKALNAQAKSFTIALADASTDDLIKAIFAVIEPFTVMFRDIVEYFKRAGANQGANHWNVAIGREIPDLKDFERFLEVWGSTEVRVEIPAIRWSQKWALHQAVEKVIPNFPYEAPTSFQEVDVWIAQNELGFYPPLPLEISPSQFPAPISDVAMICAITLERVRARWGSFRDLKAEYDQFDDTTRQRIIGFSDADALHLGTIAQDETDHWLRSTISMLARLRHLDPAILKQISAHLSATYASLPLRHFMFTTEAARLQRLLSLPVWQKRNEVYAVWIYTEIVQSLTDHKITLYHEERRLLFAFKKTKLALIETAQPPIKIYGERRVKLANPVGKKRTGNVQPDYSLWTTGDDEVCPLVVEVKHYKKAKQRDFNAVLIDYARAHPQAVVLLVNYGPLADVPDLGETHLSARCRQIGNLTSVNTAQRETFREAVSKAVGPRKWRQLIVIDVSTAMEPYLQGFWQSEFEGWFRGKWVTSEFATERMVVLADSTVRMRCNPFWTFIEIRDYSMVNERNLIAIVEELQEQAEELLFITNLLGLTDLLALPKHTASRISDQLDLWAVGIPTGTSQSPSRA